LLSKAQAAALRVSEAAARSVGLTYQQHQGCPGHQGTLMLALAAMADPKANAAEVARRLGVTTTTLYAYVNGDGTVKQAGQAVFDRP